jgi:hypothetical protein
LQVCIKREKKHRERRKERHELLSTDPGYYSKDIL